MTQRIARCEGALINAVEAMEAAIDIAMYNELSLTEAEERVFMRPPQAKGVNANGIKTELIETDTSEGEGPSPLPSYLFKALMKHKAQKRARADANNESVDIHVISPVAEVENHSPDEDDHPRLTKANASNIFSDLLTTADITSVRDNAAVVRSLMHASTHTTSTSSQAVTDIDRQRLVSSVESKLAAVKKVAQTVHEAFDNLHAAIDALPDVTFDRVELDLNALAAGNASLRDEVVALYDKSAALYESCLHLEHP